MSSRFSSRRGHNVLEKLEGNAAYSKIWTEKSNGYEKKN